MTLFNECQKAGRDRLARSGCGNDASVRINIDLIEAFLVGSNC